jgi:hypothetical protein
MFGFGKRGASKAREQAGYDAGQEFGYQTTCPCLWSVLCAPRSLVAACG